MKNPKSSDIETYTRTDQFKHHGPDDVALNNTVKVILIAEPMLFDSILCVNTVNQVVTLTGYVDSIIEKQCLDKLVLELCKFVQVINRVEVMPRLWNRTLATGITHVAH